MVIRCNQWPSVVISSRELVSTPSLSKCACSSGTCEHARERRFVRAQVRQSAGSSERERRFIRALVTA